MLSWFDCRADEHVHMNWMATNPNTKSFFLFLICFRKLLTPKVTHNASKRRGEWEVVVLQGQGGWARGRASHEGSISWSPTPSWVFCFYENGVDPTSKIVYCSLGSQNKNLKMECIGLWGPNPHDSRSRADMPLPLLTRCMQASQSRTNTDKLTQSHTHILSLSRLLCACVWMFFRATTNAQICMASNLSVWHEKLVDLHLAASV